MTCMCLGSENIEYELFLPKVVKGCGWKAFDVCKKEEEAFDVEEDLLHKELHCHFLLGLSKFIRIAVNNSSVFLFRHVHLKFIKDFTVFSMVLYLRYYLK